MTIAPIEQVTPRLYNPDGTYNRDLDLCVASDYQAKLSDAGAGSFTLWNDDPDAAEIVERSIIKFQFLGAERFGARVVRESASYSDDGCLVTWSCLGLLGALLSDAVILTETGTETTYTGKRWFGWMSEGFDDSGWTTALVTVPWGDAALSNARLGNPVDWPDENAHWMRADSGLGTHLFRSTITTTESLVLRIHTSVDESITVYFDGEELYTRDYDEVGFTNMQVYDLGIVAAGTHTIAVYMRIKATPIIGDGLDAFIFSLTTVDSANQAATVLRRSDPTNWKCYATTTNGVRPGMPRAQIMLVLLAEAQARGCHGTGLITAGFTATTDSAGVAFTDELVIGLPVMAMNLDEAFLTVCENVLDLWLDAATMQLQAFVRKGSDKSAAGAGQVALTRGENTVEGEQTGRAMDIVNVLYGRLTDGTYTSTTDTASVTAYGRVERGVSIAATVRGTGQELLGEILSDLTTPQLEYTKPQELVGALPYTDYDIGDTVAVSAHRSDSLTSARALGFTVVQPAGEDGATATPQLVHDDEGALG